MSTKNFEKDGLLIARTLVEEEPVWKSMTFHHFGLIVSATFALIAVLISFFLIWRHATHYLKPWEQRQWVPTQVLQFVFTIDPADREFVSQHYPSTLHGSYLRHCVFPIISLLPTCAIFRGHPGLLRSLCYCQFLCAALPLYSAGFTQSERLFSDIETERVGSAGELVQTMLWG